MLIIKKISKKWWRTKTKSLIAFNEKKSRKNRESEQRAELSRAEAKTKRLTRLDTQLDKLTVEQ